MTVLRCLLRSGAYHDSVVLMRLQAALAELPGVADAAVVMGTEANRELLAASGLLPEEAAGARPEDLLVVVKAENAAAAEEALGRVDPLLAARAAAAADGGFRPRTLSSAVQLLPEARWVLVSVPGRHAAAVAHEALGLGRHVFLYSDNVPLDAEVALKRAARQRGLLMMGPDCGTAIVGGVGFGFANRVRRGSVGLIGASGTGLQTVACRVHELGAGVSQALGTGGRDLAAEVGGATALQALDLLARDEATRAIVLVSKPPDPSVVARLLMAAGRAGKEVVCCFLGLPLPMRRLGNVHFTAGLDEAAEKAVELALAGDEPHGGGRRGDGTAVREEPRPAAAPGFLRALFAGGTLAYEALLALRPLLTPLHSNLSLAGVLPLSDLGRSRGHTVLDLGDDELTVGRPHPMLDNALRLRRLRQEAADPEVGAILLDVVLGEGAHPDPAAELAPAIAEARTAAAGEGRELEVIVLLVGSDEDPQGLARQAAAFGGAGARVVRTIAQAVERWWILEIGRRPGEAAAAGSDAASVPLADLDGPPAAINVGLESFHASLLAQGAAAVQVDWRPPAGGDERLAALLARMRT
ncbi:MAG TPA: acyl-CoA synthetase FdrA [Thermoanaerobaculia bacterium]|nr:acyl-CoA synthetase FdrA [Thermoanaerobaculia bacterium]